MATYQGQYADGLAFRRVAERLEAAAGEWRALQEAAEEASSQLKVLARTMSAWGFPHATESAEVAQNIASYLRETWYVSGGDRGGDMGRAPIPDFAAVDEPAAPFTLRTVAELLTLQAGSAEYPLAPALAEGLREIAGRKERMARGQR